MLVHVQEHAAHKHTLTHILTYGADKQKCSIILCVSAIWVIYASGAAMF